MKKEFSFFFCFFFYIRLQKQHNSLMYWLKVCKAWVRSQLRWAWSCLKLYVTSSNVFRITRTLLVALSLACLEMTFIVKGAGAVILLFCLEYKTSVVCHNVNTQKVKIARRDRPHILASNRCETFENLLQKILLHWGVLFQGFYTQKIERWFLSVSGAHDSVSINIHSFFVPDQDTARYSICSAQEKCVSLTEPYTTHS